MADKRMTADEAVAQLESGMTLGIGGWGSRRKPMSLVRALLRSDVKDLTVVSYGGPDVGLLCKYGKVRKLIYAFVSLDSIPLEPHFRNARQNGEIEVMEVDEGMFRVGLQAAAQRLPFLPTLAGLGSAALHTNPDIKTIDSPYDDGTRLVAMPALKMDAAFIHMNVGDAAGNGMWLSQDPYMDQLYAMASDKTFMSVEKLVPTESLLDHGPVQRLIINRMMTDGVIESPGGAHFTECPPEYGRDEKFQKEYAATAKDPEAWEAFKAKYLDVSEDEYQKAVAQ